MNLKKYVFIAFTAILSFAQSLKADEGMWLLPLLGKLNIGQMKEKGFKLTAEDIYSVNSSSIKDAIPIFGRGCTSEMVSAEGLLLTNHHCGYSNIQALSSLEHNYLDNGFWAKTKSEELPAAGLTVQFLKYMEDVTERVTSGLAIDLNEADRRVKVEAVIQDIIKEATKDNKYSAIVKSFFGGNNYYLVVYEVFSDVRLVGTPPSSIGKFGHDTDNWMWPRHTGDFSFFRVYCAPDGKPAAYSPSNVPYKPAHFLPVSLKGIEKGDFAMTIGYPGSTYRYLTSMGIEERMNITNRSRIEPRGIKQDIWLKHMQKNPTVNIQYASKYATSSNYWKNSIGMNKGLQKLDVLTKKRALETQFLNWAMEGGDATAVYKNILPSLKEAYEVRAEYMLAYSYAVECLITGTELYYFAYNAKALEKALEGQKTDEVNAAVTELRKIATEFYKNYDVATDKKTMVALLELYGKTINEEWQPTQYGIIKKKFKDDYGKYVDDLFNRSVFASNEKLNAFLDKPSLKKLSVDPAFEGGSETIELLNRLRLAMSTANEDVDMYNRLFQSGLMKMQANKVFSPGANFTMRLSYGVVGDYSPSDAVKYKHYTTLKGVMEKEDSTNWEFVVPAKLKTLYDAKDYGQYADVNGDMPVCFISDNDITGGNSGSPVINGEGHLIGLAFDGNWEAMSGDLAFEPELQKTISVDIRYVLFIVDKYAGATNLIQEMKIIK